MSHVIDYIGGDGVKTSDLGQRRFVHPQPGDPIEWPNGKLGRVDALYDPAGSWAKEGELHVCVNGGSVFLGWDSKRRRATVSISGGPFTCVRLEDLQATYQVRVVDFWNWGDNSPGADQGVYYYIGRPLFRYVGDCDDWKMR